MRPALIGVVMCLAASSAWSQPLAPLFDGGAGFGAITNTSGFIGGCPADNVEFGASFGKPSRLTGGEGIPQARDLFARKFRGGSAVTDVSSVATGGAGVLRGFVTASPPAACILGGSSPRSVAANEVMQIYNTHTIRSSTLPVGTPVSVSLKVTFAGAFSAAMASQTRRANVHACVTAAAMPDLSSPPGHGGACGLSLNTVFPWIFQQVADSTQKANVWTTDTYNLSANWTGVHPLRVGDSFMIASYLFVGAQSESGQGDISAKFSLQTTVAATTTGASIVSIQSNRPLAWGYNAYGELGDGTQTDRFTPVPVRGLSNVGAVAAGYLGSMAVDPHGNVWAWGSDGNGTSLTPFKVTDPTDPSGFLSNVRGVALGGGHNLAVKRDGSVWAWGNNSNGQLGDGTTSHCLHPVRVIDPNDVSGFLTNVLAVAASNQSSFSLALKHDGTVWAWGRNSSGQLGDNTLIDRLTPVQVQRSTGGPLTDVQMIAAGSESGLALAQVGGLVWGWGRNSDGALGDGTFVDKYSAVQVVDPTNPPHELLDLTVAISGGGAFSLALKHDGTVHAWGQRVLGTPATGVSNVPVQVRDPSDPSGTFTGGASRGGGFAAGIAHALARKADGTVRSWGLNAFGELGNGTTTGSSTPLLVSGLDRVGPLSAGAFYSLALVAINTPASPSPVTAIATAPATITFSSVTEGGTTKVTASSSGPAPPAGFTLDGGSNSAPPTYYDVITTAAFPPGSSIAICLNYSATSFAGTTTQPVFKHFDKTLAPPQWVDVMVDDWNETDNIICGTVSSLSPFALLKVIE